MTDTPKITGAEVRAAALAMYAMTAELSLSGASDLARAALKAAREAQTEPPAEDVREALAALIDEQHGNWQWDSLAHGVSAGRYIAPMVLNRFTVSPKKGQDQ